MAMDAGKVALHACMAWPHRCIQTAMDVSGIGLTRWTWRAHQRKVWARKRFNIWAEKKEGGGLNNRLN